jgi:hypothetical protein
MGGGRQIFSARVERALSACIDVASGRSGVDPLSARIIECNIAVTSEMTRTMPVDD